MKIYKTTTNTQSESFTNQNDTHLRNVGVHVLLKNLIIGEFAMGESNQFSVNVVVKCAECGAVVPAYRHGNHVDDCGNVIEFLNTSKCTCIAANSHTMEAQKTPTNNASPKSAIEIVERLAAWSRKYPQNMIHSSNVQKEHESEILSIENAAKEFVDSRLQAGG